MEVNDVIISLASNDHQKKNLTEARLRLSQVLSELRFSNELWTEPHSQKGATPLYLNQLAFGKTHLSANEMNTWLKKTEMEMGRTPKSKELGIVSIDLDLMAHNNTRFHLNDWERPYVKDLLTQAPSTSSIN